MTPTPLRFVPSAYAAALADYCSDEIAGYLRLLPEELISKAHTFLCNMVRLEDEHPIAHHDLQVALVPELCERILPGTRTKTRRISDSIAEYDSSKPSIFRRMLTAERVAMLGARAAHFRARIAATATLSADDLCSQVRFAIAGYRPQNGWSGPTGCVYDTAFVYRFVPALAHRVSAASSAAGVTP